MMNALKLFFLIVLAVAMPLSKSFADWSVGIGIGGPGYHHDHDYYGWHNHPHWGYHVHYLPPGYFTIWVGGARYYYYDGLYYNYVGDGDYVLVDPPLGAHVAAIPPDFQPVLINGVTYYTNGGVYYILTPYHGYKVVPPPVVYAQPEVVSPPMVTTTVVTAPASAPVYAQDTFPVNVPNDKGGYTAVVIKKSGSGYVGPQGEYYPNFPSVAQLKAMYGK